MFHEITIVGNLGSDPELRYTPSGQAACNFSVATNRRWTNNDGQPVEETTWFRVTSWGNAAENHNQYLSKGRQVMVKGRLVVDRDTGGPRVWQDQAGNFRATFELSAATVLYLGPPRGDRDGIEAGPSAEVTEDEIPF